MLSDAHKQFLDITTEEAEKAAHIYPTMAACEAGLESGFGSSRLAAGANNLFGTKQHQHPVFGTLNLPTREYVDGQWVVVEAAWVHYPTIRDCFVDRMATLRRLAVAYPHYAEALVAPDAISYVQAVSCTWSTDPQRANKVILIYNDYSA